MFDSFLRKESVFSNKEALQDEYVPAVLPHRNTQIQQIATILLPSLRGEHTSNVFIYGKTGTGKTIATKFVSLELEEFSRQHSLNLSIIYVNANLKKVADTEYRLIAHLASQFGASVPPTGLPTERVYEAFYEVLDATPRRVILILDEFDTLIRKCGNDLLYNLTRLNTLLKNARVSIIGITNDLQLLHHLDPRVRSSLAQEEIFFPPYDAIQLQDVLAARAPFAFHQGTLETGVIPKAAAYAAGEHGDARRALNLLRVAGELADRTGMPHVDAAHVDAALQKIETDNLLDVIRAQPQQSKNVLYSIILLKETQIEFTTGELYDKYREICGRAGHRVLTQRRVSDLIEELDMMGLIRSSIISKGRYGRTRDIQLSVSDGLLPKVVDILKPEFGY